MGFSIGKVFDKVGSVVSKVAGFAAPILAGPLGGVAKSLLGKLSPLAHKLLDSPVGKLAQKLVPNLAKKVDDFLNPAKLAAMFGGAKSPGDFAQLLGPALKNVPFLGQLFGG